MRIEPPASVVSAREYYSSRVAFVNISRVAAPEIPLRPFEHHQLLAVINRQDEVFQKYVADVYAPRLLVATCSFSKKADGRTIDGYSAYGHVGDLAFPVLRDSVVTN